MVGMLHASACTCRVGAVTGVTGLLWGLTGAEDSALSGQICLTAAAHHRVGACADSARYPARFRFSWQVIATLGFVAAVRGVLRLPV
jgi:hypothetical protein